MRCDAVPMRCDARLILRRNSGLSAALTQTLHRTQVTAVTIRSLAFPCSVPRSAGELHSVAVAVMFLVEMIAPWLLLLPSKPLRQVGVTAQAVLQIAIMLTGPHYPL